MTADFTARVMSAAQFLKANGYEDVAAFLVKSELDARHAKRPARKRKQTLYTARGEKIELYQTTVNALEADE